MIRPIQLITLCGLVLTPLCCQASAITISFSSSTEIREPGDILEFDADLINTTKLTIDLGAADVTLSGLFDTDPTPFLSGPATIGPGKSTGAFEIFTVTIPKLAAAPASNRGVLSITDINDNLLGTAAFTVVTSPEPSSGGLFLIAVAAVALFYLPLVLRRGRRT